MAHRAHVPKFGNWEGEEEVPYTVYFEKARKGRGGKGLNPNDPEYYADSLPADNSVAPPQASPLRPPTHEQKMINESDHHRQFSAELPTRPTNEARQQVHGGRGGAGLAPGDQHHRRGSRGSVGSEYSIDKSPIHPQSRLPARVMGSPFRDGSSSHGTPGRTRAGGASREELSDKVSTVPKFGAWDENDPASGEGYTHIFNKVREERQTEARNGPGYIESPYRADAERKQSKHGSKTGCFSCFWNKS
ncbi:hypothetical protein SAY86_002585 [Trapa natans]|uniref:RIN4 pathogenic type III effector avirulence factor Avr cleavage site domain-containing protein n=1 Tax=Trapa natans TaxID=22666 RepID=A0AAN7R3H8_TRANT|nr:hypothetical protein SAY86_002585 [Trapa natans]